MRDTSIRAVLVRAMLEPLRTHLQVNAASFIDADSVRSSIREYLAAARSWTISPAPPAACGGQDNTPIDVDLVKGGGNKGKCKGKKGKASGDPPLVR